MTQTHADNAQTSRPDRDAVMATFEAFKEANDQRLSAIERKATADVVLEDKVSRIEQALDRLSLSEARPQRAGVISPAASEVKAAWSSFMRRGEAQGLIGLEGKALSASSAADGGHVAPPDVAATIDRRLAASSPMRRIATVRTTMSGTFRKPVSTSAPAVGWVAEAANRPQTTTPQLDLLDFPVGELYAMAAATQTLLDDAILDLDQWLAAEIAESFATAEGAAFVGGDGVNKPKGFLSAARAADATRTWGQLGTIATGVSAGFPAANPTDKLIDLTYALSTPYRGNASFVMNRRTVSAVRKFKDTTGNYVWQPSSVLGQPATLLGFPLVECEDMPDVAAGSASIAFGDFAKGYLIVDRADVRVLRDPYSAKPYVLFYVTKRVGGGIQDFDAIKLLTFAVS
jgi:HK97 family phage major capsid protein